MENLHIISHNSEPFLNREEAGKQLASELTPFKNDKTVVLGILRGGIIIADVIAEKLDIKLDIILSRKIGAPHNPEFAIGALSENGGLFINKEAASYTGADKSYINNMSNLEMAEIIRRSNLFRKIYPKVSIEGKTVIITDDGVATGATLQSALWAARSEKPAKLIAALPVGPEDTLRKLNRDADEIICLKSPDFFNAVGQFYLQFEQVGDSEVIELLNKNREESNNEKNNKRRIDSFA